jgi:hypothetical protein
MDDTIHATLTGWHDFYLITGTAAAALTGLQFVVQTLLASDALRPVSGDDTEGGIAAFGTPTVVHFSLALLVSAVLCVPWAEYELLGVTLGVLSVGALVYSAVVLRRAVCASQTKCRLVSDEWACICGASSCRMSRRISSYVASRSATAIHWGQ